MIFFYVLGPRSLAGKGESALLHPHNSFIRAIPSKYAFSMGDFSNSSSDTSSSIFQVLFFREAKRL